GCRGTSVDLAKTEPRELERMYQDLSAQSRRLPEHQTTLAAFNVVPDAELTCELKSAAGTGLLYRLPSRVNWDALRAAYDTQPSNYEQFLGIQGIGPATVRALALVAELIYGEPASWHDPVKYSFAFGGKDGVPYPVDRRTMDETTELLQTAMKMANVKPPAPSTLRK
ncbi:MAG: DUF763 domain-containing protein, partial [Methanomicrobia archaeon]|nr:DUF763 domain-containing protein [Methanomicrobia archaeon]